MAVRRRSTGGLVTKRGPAPPITQQAGKDERPSARQAKRRPQPGQELRDGARWDPSNEADPRPEYPRSRHPWSSQSGLGPDPNPAVAQELTLAMGPLPAGGPGREP
jgi:hypothetical protein